MEVSVVIPLYNAEKYIIETLDSLLNQTHPIKEILVIDDCGPDNSKELVRNYSVKYPIIKLVEKEKNEGASASRNRGITLAQSDWILFMDADDIISRDLLEKYRLALEKNIHNDVIAVHSAYMQINEESEFISKDVLRGKQYTVQDAFGSLLVRNHILTPSGLLVKKEMAQAIGGFTSGLPMCEDADFYFRLAKKGYILYVDEPLTFVRRHLTNLTENASKAYDAGKMILNLYPIEEIKEAVLGRSYSDTQNKQDLAKVLYQRGNFDEAFEILNSITTQENLSTTYFLKSLYFLEKRIYKEVFNLLNSIMAIDPQHGASINNLGVIEALNGNRENAIQYFNKAIELYPNYIDANHNLKVSLGEKEGEYKFTLRELRKTLLNYTSI